MFDNAEKFRKQRNGGNWLSNPPPPWFVDYITLSLCTYTEKEMSCWWNFYHCFALQVDNDLIQCKPVVKIRSKLWHFHFCVVFYCSTVIFLQNIPNRYSSALAIWYLMYFCELNIGYVFNVRHCKAMCNIMLWFFMLWWDQWNNLPFILVKSLLWNIFFIDWFLIEVLLAFLESTHDNECIITSLISFLQAP